MSDINCKSVFGSAVVRRTFLAAAGVLLAGSHLRRLCESNKQENNKQENNKQERNGT